MSEDTSWVFDSLVCFLHGPIWNAPLQTFVEEKSLIFDPNGPSDESNPEYITIHNEFKNLVDFMLGSFMEEMEISPEQFEVACLEGRQNGPDNAFSFHQGLFQQIWAANDIRIFVRMMTQRNVELQLQALDMIERRQHSTQSTDDNNGDNFEQNAAAAGVSTEIKIDDDEAAEKELFDTIENELTKTSTETAVTAAVTDDIIQAEDKFQRLNLFFEKETISSADIESRQKYLRDQRDKILKIKKKARANQLNESVKKNGRPSSAQAAQTILNDGHDKAMIIGSSEGNAASMQLRKTLAKRLKEEVVDQQK